MEHFHGVCRVNPQGLFLINVVLVSEEKELLKHMAK